MSQCNQQNKLVDYFDQDLSDSIVKLKTTSIKSPVSTTIVSLKRNSTSSDLSTCNSFYERFIENLPSSLSTSSRMQFITSPDSHTQMSAISEMNRSNNMFISSSNNQESDYKSNINLALTASIKIPRIRVMTSTGDNLSNTLPVTATSIPESDVLYSKRHNVVTSHEDDNDYINNYRLSNFYIRIEQIPSMWMTDSKNETSVKHDHHNKQSVAIMNRKSRRSPVLRKFVKSPTKSLEDNILSDTQFNQMNGTENNHNRSPQYRRRHSHSHSFEKKTTSKINLNKTSEMILESSRSPVFSRYPQLQIQRITNFNFDTTDLTTQPISSTSSNANGSMLSLDSEKRDESSNENEMIGVRSSSTAVKKDNKRLFQSSSHEKIFVKRRHYKNAPIIITQQSLCISYPNDVPRCVDCRTINSIDMSMQSASCRFQYCRILRYIGDNKYEIEGFTTIDDAKSQDIQYFLRSNSGGQPSLNYIYANYIFTHLAKVFCLMFLHEENERSQQNKNSIIWKQYMAGWREVCDECSTTLFNYHYTCKECGYMICIECSNTLSQMNSEKRKKMKRICIHDYTYSLSEFIPWEVMVKLRQDTIEYLSKLEMDCSTKLYPSSKTEHLSMFIKSLKMKRALELSDIKQTWTSIDCNYDPNIEFYCNGRLPVFNEWTSENAKQFFQKVWLSSCPVLVKKVHHNLSTTLWHPNSFKLHMIDHHETPLLWDCETLASIQTNETILKRFWEGFERLNIRLRDDENGGRSRILKLKDWPTKKDFASVFPERLHDLMNNIPFSDYTRRSYVHNGVTYNGGVYNIVERLPTCLVKPDLGPKLYIAYSQLTSKESKKAGTTNLHIDVSDAVNVLVYVGIGGHGDDGCDKEEEIRRVEAEILCSNIDEPQLQRLRNGERPGALWHLFRSDDAQKIREYINRAQRKVSGSDYIHDQTAYLEQEDLENLRLLSNVEAYPILQFFGDAVFIPSGAPHQVKNLHSCIKIAEDFVSPENLDRCLITTNEFRSLSKHHTNHADILQAKNILFYTVRDSLNSLFETDRNEITQEDSLLDQLDKFVFV